MEVQVLKATGFDAERVPKGYTQPPKVAVPLASGFYIGLLMKQEQRAFDYHLLVHPGYSMFNPIAFDAGAYLDEALQYCRQNKVDSVMGFDCFPAMLASIIKEELGVAGPNSWSTFLCINKFYLRKTLTPGFGPIAPNASVPDSFPAVLKVSDTQFYVGTHIVRDRSEWDGAYADVKSGLMGAGVEARQEFYFKWGKKLGWPVDWSSKADVVLMHTEPCIQAVGEYQAEVVVQADGTLVVADTGDLDKPEGSPWIVAFKTPGTITFTPGLKEFLRGVAGKMSELGYRSGAMDIEFMRVKGDTEAYEVVEINSRYSYMGNYLHMGCPDGALRSSLHIEQQTPLEVRNLLNRTRLSLGADPSTLPCRDRPCVAKLALMVYTNKRGPLDEFFDCEALNGFVNDGTLDGWTGKIVYQRKEVTDFDLRQFGGWAKVGCMLATWENRQDDMNKKLAEIMKALFRGRDDLFLPVVLIDEDGPGPTKLAPDALQDPVQQKKPQTKPQTQEVANQAPPTCCTIS